MKLLKLIKSQYNNIQKLLKLNNLPSTDKCNEQLSNIRLSIHNITKTLTELNKAISYDSITDIEYNVNIIKNNIKTLDIDDVEDYIIDLEHSYKEIIDKLFYIIEKENIDLSKYTILDQQISDSIQKQCKISNILDNI